MILLEWLQDADGRARRERLARQSGMLTLGEGIFWAAFIFTAISLVTGEFYLVGLLICLAILSHWYLYYGG